MKLFSILLLQAAALAADPGLLRLVMPGAKIIAGAQIDQAKNSPFGMYVLNHLQLDDPNLAKLMASTGFDPRRDLREVLVASSAASYDPSHWLVLARGVFDPARIQEAAQANGGAVSKHQGVPIVSGSADQGPTGAVAFLDASTAVMGDPQAVEAAIDRRKTSAKASASMKLSSKIREVSAKYDFWFTTTVPLAEFAGVMPDANLKQAMKGNVLGAIQETTGGIKFGDTVSVHLEALTRSPQDASALVDVVKFIAGLIQTNRQADKTAAQVSTLLDNLQTNTQGNTMTMTLAIPESTLEQMLATLRQDRGAAPKDRGVKK